jgi:spermidine/putrescine transport system substrate-binding protein
VEGQASAVQAWDGWCEYGRAEDPNIDFVIPSEGSDVWTDTMVILESSENKEAAHAFIDFVLTPEIGKAVAELVLYKVPNQPAMESLDPQFVADFPTLGITPDELLAQEPETSLGPEGLLAWTQVATEIKAG